MKNNPTILNNIVITLMYLNIENENKTFKDTKATGINQIKQAFNNMLNKALKQ